MIISSPEISKSYEPNKSCCSHILCSIPTLRHYIVFELATGGELFDRILSKGRFTEADAIEALKYGFHPEGDSLH